MERDVQVRQKAQLALSAVALVLLLLYTWYHTGTLLARYVDHDWIGYVAAAGIEIAVVALALQIGNRKRKGVDATFFYFVLVAVVVVSFFANVAEGHVSKRGVEITLESVQSLDLLQGIIGVSATGVLSLIVFAMAENVGQDVKEVSETQVEVESEVEQLEPPTKTEHVKLLAQEHPDWTQAQIAEAAGCSSSHVSRVLSSQKGEGEDER